MEMRCRYNPDEHGTYRGPVDLGRHYKQAHGDVHVSSYKQPTPADRRQCNVCGETFNRKSALAHVRAKHGSDNWRTLTKAYTNHGARATVDHDAQTEPMQRDVDSNAKRQRCDLCGIEMRRDSMSKHFRNKHAGMTARGNVTTLDSSMSTHPSTLVRVEQQSSRDDVHLDSGFGVDDIVMPVIEQLASPLGLVPVAALGALFVWRDQTAAMLRAVTRSE